MAGQLGIEHDSLYLEGSLENPLKFQAPALTLDGTTTVSRLLDRRTLLKDIDRMERDATIGRIASPTCSPAAEFRADGPTATATNTPSIPPIGA